MLKSEMYFEGRTDRFADRLDMGHERKELPAKDQEGTFCHYRNVLCHNYGRSYTILCSVKTHCMCI